MNIDIPGEELVCPECGKDFKTAQGVGAHRAKAHGYRRDRSAPVPEKMTLRELSRHSSSHEEMTAEITSTLNAVIEASSFEGRLQSFLPHLAFKALERIREGDPELAEMFLVLYLDGQ